MVRFISAYFLVSTLWCVSAEEQTTCVVKILALFSGNIQEKKYYPCTNTVTIVNETLEGFSFLGNIADNVSKFQLSGSRLMEIPEAPERNNLLELDLSQNNISEIANLSSYIHLTKVDLSYNQIETVPELDLPNLIYLNLSHNQIVHIFPDSFKKVKNLKYLNLHNNRLSKIEMCTFKEVIYVNISANPTLEPPMLLCQRCFFETPSLSFTGFPSYSNCGMDEERIMTVTTRIGTEDDKNDEHGLIIGVTIAAVAFLVALIVTTALIYQKVLGRRQIGSYAPNAAVKEPTEMTKLS